MCGWCICVCGVLMCYVCVVCDGVDDGVDDGVCVCVVCVVCCCVECVFWV